MNRLVFLLALALPVSVFADDIVPLDLGGGQYLVAAPVPEGVDYVGFFPDGGSPQFSGTDTFVLGRCGGACCAFDFEGGVYKAPLGSEVIALKKMALAPTQRVSVRFGCENCRENHSALGFLRSLLLPLAPVADPFTAVLAIAPPAGPPPPPPPPPPDPNEPPPPPPPTGPGIIFSESFDAGNKGAFDWDADGRTSYTSTGCHSGSCGVKTLTSTANQQRVYWEETFGNISSPQFYVSWWVNFPAGYSFAGVPGIPDFGLEHKALIINVAGTSEGRALAVNFRYESGQISTHMEGLESNSGVSAFSGVALPRDGAWHRLEYLVDRSPNPATGRVRVWLDGAAIIDAAGGTCPASGCQPISFMQLGAFRNQGNPQVQSFKLDDVVVGTSRPAPQVQNLSRCEQLLASDPDVLRCEDFEDPAINAGGDIVPGHAWYARFGGTSGGMACEGPGAPCAVDVVAAGQCNAGGESGGSCVFDGAQSLGFPYRPGSNGGNLGEFRFADSPIRTFGVTYALRMSRDLAFPHAAKFNRLFGPQRNVDGSIHELLGSNTNEGFLRGTTLLSGPRNAPFQALWDQNECPAYLGSPRRACSDQTRTVVHAGEWGENDVHGIAQPSTTAYSFAASKGVWRCMQFHVRDWGTADARMRWWVDGAPVIDIEHVDLRRIRGADVVGLQGLRMEHYVNERVAAPAYRYEDNIVVTQGGEPVSCSAIGF